MKGKAKTKKQLTIGKQEYVNTNTGQVETFNVITERDSDFNFEKIWLSHLLEALDMIGNKKIHVLNYLLKNRDTKNQVIATQRKIAKDLGIALKTVQSTMKTLQSSNAIKQVQQGVYMLNPDIVFKGGNKKRMNILLKYEQIEEHEQIPELTRDPNTVDAFSGKPDSEN